MNKKIKLIIICFCVLVLSGCTVDYEIKFDSNGMIFEKMTIMEDISKLKNQQIYSDSYFNNTIDQYKNIDDFSNAKFKIVKKAGKKGVEIINSYNKDEYNNVNTILSLSGVSSQYLNNFFLITADSINNVVDNLGATDEKLEISNIKMTVNSEYGIEKSNSNYSDTDSNKFVWEFGSRVKDDIIITHNDKKRYDVIIKNYITKNILLYSIIGLITILIAIVSFIFFTKYKKNNRI